MDNSSGPVYLSATNLAVLNNGTNADIVTNITGNVYVPKTPETFLYDADGNVTNDGRWTFTWDSENRLLSMQALSSVPSGAKKKLDFVYDYQGRRIQKVVSTWNGSAYVAQSTNKFVYDRWNLMAEVNGTNGVIRTFTWGLDLSGTAQGAGGVGALLAIKPANGNPLFVAYDGNGNVTGLIDGTTGTTSGQFEYGPFGETIRLTPNSNSQSPFRFSTKYQDGESDFLYYGYRYYDPSKGRWLSRDLVGENGGLNLYGFVHQDPIDLMDLFGLDPASQYGISASPSPTPYPLPTPTVPVTPYGPTGPAFPGTSAAQPQGSGSIQQPLPAAPPRGIGVPPNQSTGSKTGDTPAGAAAGILEIDAKMLSIGLEQRSFNENLERGFKDCLAQAKGRCRGCCLINLYFLRGKYDSYRKLVYHSSQFFSKPCFMVQADRDGMTGSAYKPYLGRWGYPGVGDDPVFGWFYRLFHNDAREVPIDYQNYLPQFQDIQ